MKRVVRYLLIVIFTSGANQSFTQTYADKAHYLVDSLNLEKLSDSDRQLVDSCLKVYHTSKHDTDRIKAINHIVEESWDDYLWPKYNWWVYHFIQNKLLDQPPSVVKKQLSISLAVALSNKGYIYDTQGDILQALEYYHSSLKISEEIGHKLGITSSLNNIAYVYEHQGDTLQALEYHHRSLRIREEIGDKQGLATSLNNIGYIYDNQGNIAQALEYHHRSLKIREEIGDKDGIASSLNNIGGMYLIQENIPKALEYTYRSLKIYEELGNKEGIAAILSNIGHLELKQVALVSAQTHLERGLKLALEVGSPQWISANSRLLSKVAKKQGNYKEALEMYELHIKMRDSIKNEETQKATIRQQTKYEFEKAQLVKEQEEKEAARIIAEETSRRDNLQYSVILLGLLVLGTLVLGLGKLALPPRMAEGIIFFSFLILFEFLLVLADPYIDKWSGGAPGIKLLFNAGIAALIFPAHAFFESKLKGRLVKK